MNDNCEYYRKQIADSISSDLTSSDQTDLEEHLVRCSECKDYKNSLVQDERLLLGYVNHFEAAISEVKTAALESLKENPKVSDEESVPLWRNLMKLKYAAGLVIIVAAILAIGHFSGAFRGSTPAIAKVLEEISKKKDVSYRILYQVEGIAPFETRDYSNSKGIQRKEYLEIGSVTIQDRTGGKQFHLDNKCNMAKLTHKVGKPQKEGLSNHLEWVQALHKRSAKYVGIEKVDSKEAYLFINEEDIYYVIRIWVDPATDLPIKAQFVSIPNPYIDIISPRISLRKFDFGNLPGVAESISYRAKGGITRAATVTMDKFVWDSNLDDSLFSMKVPEGYNFEVDSLDVSEIEEQDLIDALTLWTEMSNGAFPDDINDLGTDEIASPLLVSQFNGEGDPEREFDNAMAAANSLCKGCLFAQEMKVEGNWFYRGEGVRIGNANIPVCWWREQDSDMFRIMYDDLRVEDIQEKNLPDR